MDFILAFGKRPDGRSPRSETERFWPFPLKEIADRNYNLDIRWLKDDSAQDEELAAPDVLIDDISALLLDALDATKQLSDQFKAPTASSA